jgi:hypothetical protein
MPAFVPADNSTVFATAVKGAEGTTNAFPEYKDVQRTKRALEIYPCITQFEPL